MNIRLYSDWDLDIKCDFPEHAESEAHKVPVDIFLCKEFILILEEGLELRRQEHAVSCRQLRDVAEIHGGN